jgi:hypothetical protein
MMMMMMMMMMMIIIIISLHCKNTAEYINTLHGWMHSFLRLQQAVYIATKGPKCLTAAPAFSRLSLSLRKLRFLTQSDKQFCLLFSRHEISAATN